MMVKGKKEITSDTSVSTIEELVSELQTNGDPAFGLHNIKSEMCDIKRVSEDDCYIKWEPIKSEELHIKSEEYETLKGFSQSLDTTGAITYYQSLDQNDTEICTVGKLENNVNTNSASSEQHIPIYKPTKSLPCQACDFQCSVKRNLKLYNQTHTTSGKKPFVCAVCGYKYSSRSSLTRHNRIHREPEPFKCNLCAYTSTWKSNIRLHIVIHKDEKPYKCGICRYTCNQMGHLQRHMLTHTAEKPFECTVCGHKYFAKSDLKRHTQIHTGKKPFQCGTCGFRCTYKGNLRNHFLTHTDEKPYGCVECGYKSSLKSNLKRHSLTHTRAN